MRKPILAFCITVSVFTSCSRNEQVSQNLQTSIYFDIKGFFEQEASRLGKDTTSIHKEIARNGGIKESKTISIKDWEKELSLFIESDINKPAWTSSYEVINEGDDIIYTSSDPELRTKKIIVNKNGENVESITIHNEVKNQLYTSQEELFYSPDSVYRIHKEQDVRVIGTNSYLVVGSFN